LTVSNVQKNFTFKLGIYLVQGDREFDLHNNFDFLEVHYSAAERSAFLSWARCDREGVSSRNPALLRLDFFEVSEFRFMPRDPEIPFTEDDCLRSAGYWVDEEWCDGVAIPASDPGPEWFNAFEFMSGAIIALKAARATATISK
jgi:hypothetical protein